MATRIKPNNNGHSNGSMSNHFLHINDWFASMKDGKVSSSFNYNPKLNAEIHLAIIEESSNYASSICDHLFTLYHDVQHRPLVLQFLPSFVIAYYNVLYRSTESVDVTNKDVCSTIDTFLVSLYNLDITDNGHNEKIYEFRIPNLTLSSIYHTPNPDYYAPTPLTQHAISKHETKGEVIRVHSFTPFDSVNGTTSGSKLMNTYQGEQILWFLLIQYGSNVSLMDKSSQQSYIQMCQKLLGQGFSFNVDLSIKTKSALPPAGRRIRVSSRIMSEILGTLFYLKSNLSGNTVDESMRLLKKRAEYEMYADVILMTESMQYLHEFESQRPEKSEGIGIEIELPPTIDVVRQRRTATTTRSMKNRQRSSKPLDTTVHTENSPDENVNTKPASPQQQRPILNIVHENSPKTDRHNHKKIRDVQSSPLIDEARTSVSSIIGPTQSTPSSSPRQYRPVSLTSTQTYFNNIQQHGTSPILLAKSTIRTDEEHSEKEFRTVSPKPRASSIRQGEKKDTIATVRFVGDTSDEDDAFIEETYL